MEENSMSNTPTQGDAIPTGTTGRAVLRRLLQAVALVIVCLVVLDGALRLVLPKTGLLRQTVDIQSPEMLYAQLEEFRRFDGVKIVTLGDSLVFGRTMRDHGDEDWQSHTLAAQLESRLAQSRAGCPVMVANFGMNGTLPADLDELMRIILPLKPDLVVFDLSLRSFSRDFEAEDKRYARPWLRDLSVSPDGRYQTAGSVSSFTDIGATYRDALVNHWYLYRMKDMIQAVAFDGQPAAFLTRTRDALDAKLKGEDGAAFGEDDLMLLFKARARYDGIDLEADNPQRQALERLLGRLRDAAQPAVGFYATEDRERLEDLIERPRFDDLQAQLAGIMQDEGNKAEENVAWVGPLDVFNPDHYLDHVHLDRHGYGRLSDALLPQVEAMLTKADLCQ